MFRIILLNEVCSSTQSKKIGSGVFLGSCPGILASLWGLLMQVRVMGTEPNVCVMRAERLVRVAVFLRTLLN
jgi:hypothetical protein